MTSAPVYLAARDASGIGLRVVFTKPGDRWEHTIERLQGDTSAPQLKSTEGEPTDDWPPSPPFQELSQETLPDGRTVLFLVGRAGTSHWSASIEANNHPPQLVFDIACRHSQTPQLLGSAYGVIATQASLEAILGVLTKSSVSPLEVTAKLPGTTRWKYRVVPAPTT